MCNFAADNNYNDMIGRTIATDIEKDFQSGKIIVITGARQVGKKIYFYDNGIRNALITNFAALELRNDKGALWENYLVSERIKKLRNTGDYSQCYFWRTNTQQEIDLIEECDEKMRAYEFKWKDEKAKMPAIFAETYPEATFQVINTVNYQDWLK